MPKREVEVFGVAGDVVAHVLAHVAVPASAPVVTRAASLYDERYVAWWREGSSYPSELRGSSYPSGIADASLIGALLARAPDGHLLQAMLVAFEEPTKLAAALNGEAAALATTLEGTGPHAEVARDAVRRLAVDGRDLLEIVWASIGLAWPSYSERWARLLRRPMKDSCADVGHELHELVRALPLVARETVRLSHPLGLRARCFPEIIVVGAPARWNDLGPGDAAVRVAHEAAVRAAAEMIEQAGWTDGSAERAESHWALVEDLALRGVELRLRGHRHHAVHARFVANLDVAGLRRADDALLAELVARLDG